ncbi:MAG TPA: Ig-like domain-containing protein [Vulgatibacter sp.]
MPSNVVALLVASIFAIACGEDPAPPVEVALIQIDPEALDLEVGESAMLQATAFDEAGQRLKASAARWTSGDPSVASVDAEGTLVGVAVGEATITAAIGGKAGKASVRVIPAKVDAVSVTPAGARLFPEETLQLEAMALSYRGAPLENRAVAWTSDAPEIASVSDAGLVRARTPGSAEILATVDGVPAAVQVTVLPRISVIRIEPERLVLFEGEEGSIVATVVGTNGAELDDREIVWTAAEPEVARVEESGAVFALRPGETQVYAEAEGIVGMATIEVRARPASVRIEPPSLLLQVDTTWGLSAIVTDTIGGEHPGEGCIWSSAAPEVIGIFADGSVHALAEGEGRLRVRCEGHEASIDAKVIPRASPSILGPGKVVVGEETIRLEATMEGRPPAGPLRWTWGPSDRLDVAQDGTVTGLLPGRPWVFASAEGRSVGREILSVLRFEELFGGAWGTCGRIRDGRVFCWGESRMYFWGHTSSFPTPVPGPMVEPRRLEDFALAKLSLRETFGMAVLTDGSGAATWGCVEDCYDETRGSELDLVRSAGPIAEVSAGYTIFRVRPPPSQPYGLVNLWCVLTADGRVGCGGPGMLNPPLLPPIREPIPDTFLHRIPFADGAFRNGFANTDQRFVDVEVGVASVCALTAEGEVWCWGSGGIDRVGGLDFERGAGSDLPAPLPGAPALRTLSAGKSHFCGVTEAGAAWCWGHSREGALGAGFAGSSEAPVKVAGGHAFRHVQASIEHTCGLTLEGEVWCWGRGELEPVLVPTEGTIVQVVAGAAHLCVLRDDGVALCRGDNGRFQAGDDIAPDVPLPRPIYPENRE